jgi:hypothetical protein
MTPWTRSLPAATSLCVGLVLGGCSRYWDANRAPEGYSIVREHVVFSPNNNPPVRSELDYTLIDVDGGPITRESYPKFVDLQPGALVVAGVHRFRARVEPVLRPPDYKPHEVSFEGRVESGKVYFLVEQQKAPALVEARPRYP